MKKHQKMVVMHDVSDSSFSKTKQNKKNRSALPGCGCGPSRLSNRAHLVLRLLPAELGLLLPRQQQPRSCWRGSVRQLGLIIPLLALMWFVRLYLHYCSQWLYLQAIAVPVNKWVCFLWYCPEHTHTHKHKDTHALTHRAELHRPFLNTRCYWHKSLHGGQIHVWITVEFICRLLMHTPVMCHTHVHCMQGRRHWRVYVVKRDV